MVVYSYIHGACFGYFNNFGWGSAEVEMDGKGDVRRFSYADSTIKYVFW
jgi:hypothetical protein